MIRLLEKLKSLKFTYVKIRIILKDISALNILVGLYDYRHRRVWGRRGLAETFYVRHECYEKYIHPSFPQVLPLIPARTLETSSPSLRNKAVELASGVAFLVFGPQSVAQLNDCDLQQKSHCGYEEFYGDAIVARLEDMVCIYVIGVSLRYYGRRNGVALKSTTSA